MPLGESILPNLQGKMRGRNHFQRPRSVLGWEQKRNNVMKTRLRGHLRKGEGFDER